MELSVRDTHFTSQKYSDACRGGVAATRVKVEPQPVVDPREFIDFSCRLTGGPIPADHGYSLYSALSRILPALHPPSRKALGIDQDGVSAPLWFSSAIHPIRGKLIGSRQLSL